MTHDRRDDHRDDHRDYDELAVGWALHALEPEDEAVFARHLPDCARCARTVAETSDVMAAMAGDLPRAEPSPELRSRLRAAVERTEQVGVPERDDAGDLDELDDFEEPARSSGPVPPRRATGFPLYEDRGPRVPEERPVWRRLLPSALVAAAVAAVLGLGTWNVVLGEARDRAEATARSQASILETLLQPGQVTIAPLSGDEGGVVATVVAREGHIDVVSDGLAVNDSSRTTYVVWGMQDDTPVALGTFDVGHPRTELRAVRSDGTGLDDYPAYAVSIEPGRSAPTTPTDVVAQGQVTS